MNYVKTIFYIYMFTSGIKFARKFAIITKKIVALLEEMKISLKICLIIEKN